MHHLDILKKLIPYLNWLCGAEWSYGIVLYTLYVIDAYEDVVKRRAVSLIEDVNMSHTLADSEISI